MEEIGSLDQKQKEESINNPNETGEELHSHSKDVESESNDINTKKKRPPRKTNRTKSTETFHIEPVVLQLDFECLKCCQKFNSLNELEDHTSNHEVDKVQLKAVDTHSSKKYGNIKNDTQRAKTNAFESCERNDDYIVSLEMECENVEEEHEKSIGFRTVASGDVQTINKEYTIENVAFEAKECPSADTEPFVCTHCEKSFKTFAEYKVHTATHDIELEDQKVIKPSETEPLTNRIKVFAEIHVSELGLLCDYCFKIGFADQFSQQSKCLEIKTVSGRFLRCPGILDIVRALVFQCIILFKLLLKIQMY